MPRCYNHAPLRFNFNFNRSQQNEQGTADRQVPHCDSSSSREGVRMLLPDGETPEWFHDEEERRIRFEVQYRYGLMKVPSPLPHPSLELLHMRCADGAYDSLHCQRE